MLELKEKRMNLAKEASDILDNAHGEQRALTADEQTKFDELKKQMADVDAEIRALEEAEKAEAEAEKAEAESKEKEEEERKAEEVEKTVPEERKNVNVNLNNEKKMEKFSLIASINDVVARRGLNDVASEVNEQGLSEFRKSGIEPTGQIVLPSEYRAVIAAGTTNAGKEAIATDTTQMLEPLYNKSIFADLGATMLTGLVGNVTIPTLGAGSAAWKAETGNAADAAPTTGGVTLTPKRLCAYVDISKQFLAQDSVGAEALIRADIVRAIQDKLEQTVFGNGDGKEGGSAIIAPVGLFNGVSAESTDLTYGDIVDILATMEGNKIYDGKFVLNPQAKAALAKTGVKGAGDTASLGFVYANNGVLGLPAISSGNVVAKGMAYADWANLVVAQWGGISITVDPYTQSVGGKVRLVVDAFFDAKMRRTNAVSAKILK